METSRQIDVTSLDAAHRRVLEDLIGTQLRQNQRLIISVSEVHIATPAEDHAPGQSIADWVNVYSGLADVQIEDIDRDFTTRADLTRPLP